MTTLRGVRRLTTAAAAAILLVACTGADEQQPPPGDAATEKRATACDGTIGAETISGDLVVPRNESCRLEGTAVDGRTTVEPGASLVAVSAYLGEGVGAHSYRKVELLGDRVEGRSRNWRYDYADPFTSRQRDYVFDGGRSLVIRDGDPNGSYHVHDTRGRVEIVGLDLDLGSIFCAGNERRPTVKRVSAESPGVLGGQCAGIRNFGESDF